MLASTRHMAALLKLAPMMATVSHAVCFSSAIDSHWSTFDVSRHFFSTRLSLRYDTGKVGTSELPTIVARSKSADERNSACSGGGAGGTNVAMALEAALETGCRTTRSEGLMCTVTSTGNGDSKGCSER